MPLRYNAVTMGTFTLCQTREETVNGELVEVKDEKGRQVYNKFPIQIRQGNCLAVFLYIYKQKEPEIPSKPWVHRLVLFFGDEQHIRNCMRDYDHGHAFESMFSGKLKNIRLNVYYKEMITLAKYMTRDGLKVLTYYKEPKSAKKEKK